jgi:signal transduction histidine kinase
MEDRVDTTAALEALAQAAARIRAGDEPAEGLVANATASLPPAAATAARALLDDLVAMRRRLQSANEARETLLAGVAHDLRNPLNTFAMSTGLLRDDFDRDDVDPARELALLGRMERGIERMRRIIDDLVDASRIEARKVDLVRKPESAAHLVRDAILAAAPMAQERTAKLVEGAVDADARVAVDRARAIQAISKAIAFTIRACGEGGTIRVSAERATEGVRFATQATPPNGAVIAPSHDGRGGIALVIARGIVEAHGGHLEIEVGQRVSVAFTLPAVEARA